MHARAALRIGLLAMLLPTAVAAQGDCDIISSGTATGQNQGTPQEVLTITVPVVHCAGGRRLRADYAVLSRASGMLNLLGNVHFQDSARTLTSTNAQYFSQQRILIASGNAVLQHGTTNSVIRGEQVEYHETSEQRPESLVRAMGGTPRAVLRRDGKPDSTTLDAQQIEIFGETRLRGTGSAVLNRDSLRAVAQTIEYSQDTRQLQLSGPRSRVEVPRYELYGDSITAEMTEGDRLREVLTRHNAQLWSAQLDLTAPAAKLFFDTVGVNRVVAMNWQPVPGAPAPARPHVESQELRLDADSLDVLAPEQKITEAVAIGKAYGERLTADSLKPLLPEAEPDVARLIANDWMRGDSVRAFFVENPKAAQDTAAPVRTMERLLAYGKPAQSMYRVRDADKPAAKLSISYLIGTAIEVRFLAGEVAEVISPDAVGIFLEPADAARRANPNRTGTGGRMRRP
jgi:lipopolysaccharide export system protein LptA